MGVKDLGKVFSMKKIENFINGKLVAAKSGETTELINPSTGAIFANAVKSNSVDVDAAMAAAKKGFEVWKESTPSERSRALLKIADAFRISCQ